MRNFTLKPEMINGNKTSYLILLLDFSLLNIAFFSLYYWKRDTIYLTANYGKLLLIFYIVWFFSALLTKKNKKFIYYEYSYAISVFLKATIYNLYFIALILVIMGLGNYSRLQVFGTWILLFFAEAAIVNLFEIIGRNGTENSTILMLSDFGLVIVSFFIVNYYKRGTFKFSPEYEKIFIILIGVWFFASLITKKYSKKSLDRNYIYVLASCVKAVFLMAAFLSVLIFSFHLFIFSRLQIYGSIILLLICETFLYSLFKAIQKDKNLEKDIESLEEVKEIIAQEDLPMQADQDDCFCTKKPVSEKLKDNYLSNNHTLYKFLNENINLSIIDEDRTSVLSSNELYNFQTISDNSKFLFINLHKINDFRWLNRYFLEVHKKLINGGYFVGRSHTLYTNKQHVYKKYPRYYREIIYFLNFIIHRVWPKLPGLKKIYFIFTKGRQRLISRAEILGRLYFCGFKLINEMEDNRRYYFIVRKAKTVSIDANPSYGPIVRLKRYGIGNKIIHTYKLRTMYPYSEYIQVYLYQNNSLKRGGKFQNDFRISTLGKIMRKMWIDELPMIYNWVKGDLKLVGVRPLSPQYFSLYDKELKKLRQKVQPGIIPPFYADMPESLEEICNSERRYIENYLKNPFKTQWSYFWKALYNILIKGARSN